MALVVEAKMMYVVSRPMKKKGFHFSIKNYHKFIISEVNMLTKFIKI